MGRRAAVTCVFLSSALLILTLPPFRQSGLAGIAIVPFLLLARQENSFWKNFLLGILAALPYCAIGLYWLLYYDVWTYFDVLISYLPFFGLFLGLTGLFLRKLKSNMLAYFFVPPIVWASLSFLYDQTPLSGIGTQALFYQSLEWMQSARIFGVYGIVFLFVMLNASIALIFKFHSTKRWMPLLVSILLLLGNFLWGKRALADSFMGHRTVALIQHNFPVDKTWWMKNQGLILSQYRSLALEAAKKKPELIIFPSYSLPFDSYRDPQFFEELAKETQVHLLLATYIPKIPKRRIADVGQYEIALLFSPEGKIAGVDRSVLGPPFRRIRQVFAEETDLLETPLGKMGALLCIEDVLPRLAKAEVKKGAELLVTLSNTGHFTKTFAPEYHLFQDQLRAIETGLFVIRVSTNGYSAIIDPRGRILKRSQLGKEEILYG